VPSKVLAEADRAASALDLRSSALGRPPQLGQGQSAQGERPGLTGLSLSVRSGPLRLPDQGRWTDRIIRGVMCRLRLLPRRAVAQQQPERWCLRCSQEIKTAPVAATTHGQPQPFVVGEARTGSDAQTAGQSGLTAAAARGVCSSAAGEQQSAHGQPERPAQRGTATAGWPGEQTNPSGTREGREDHPGVSAGVGAGGASCRGTDCRPPREKAFGGFSPPPALEWREWSWTGNHGLHAGLPARSVAERTLVSSTSQADGEQNHHPRRRPVVLVPPCLSGRPWW